MAFLSEFHFEVNHIKGKENKVANALSWRTHDVYEITVSQLEGDLLSKIKKLELMMLNMVTYWINCCQKM